jgi:hypothetical protein
MIRLGGRFCVIFSLSVVYPCNSIKMCLTETCRKIVTGKHLPDIFSTQNGLIQDALLPLLSIFAVEYAIRKVQEH